MKQETTNEQTARLILLGFKKPYGTTERQEFIGNRWVTISESHGNYTIGQLLTFLPETATQRIRYVATKRAWIVDVDELGRQGRCHRGSYHRELVDALFAAILKLKNIIEI